jgi:molybdenum cofactor sulfurtransferase
MKSNLYGNPHSASPSSHLSTVQVEEVRSRLLHFFKADPNHFDLIFVANATAAIKLVVEAFRDVDEGFWYGYHRDAHTSIVGVRQHAKEARCFASDGEVDDWIKERNELPCATNLFAYPAQSNMNGHRTPLSWPGQIRKSSRQKVYTLLDAAAYVMTAPLDLSDTESAPDFTAMSFYKIFGFPNLGALIVRKSAGDVLQQRKFFGGGTVEMVIALQSPWHAMKEHVLHEQLEDGTLPFHSIVALGVGLNVFYDLYGSMANVSRHTCSLALDLYSRLSSLRHSNGQAVCHFYKDPTSQYGNAKTQGPTLALNFMNAQGGWIGKSDVERLAIMHDIHIRTGGVCNPGGIAAFCDLQAWELRRNFSEGMRCGNDLDILGGKPTGIIRVSFGAMSSIDDVNKFFEFAQDMFVETLGGFLMNPSSLAIANDLVIEKVQIFPVAGCPGWEVPKHEAWSIGSTGLTWDREWCIVSQDDGSLLDIIAYDAMRTIQPFINREKGTLRLVAAKEETSDNMSNDEITVSLWDSPAASTQPFPTSTSDLPRRPFDIYTSPVISTFFTSLLGTPCTLARFQHPEKVAKEHHSPSSSPTTAPSTSTKIPVNTITVTIPDSTYNQKTLPQSNITLAPSPYRTFNTPPPYLRIREQFFEVLPSPSDTSPSTTFTITHIPNPRACTLSSQDPTLTALSPVSFITTPVNYPSLLAALSARSLRPSQICPLWHCRRSFACAGDLNMHIHAHIRKAPAQVDTVMSYMSGMGVVRPRPKISHTHTPSTSTTSTNMTDDTINTISTVATEASGGVSDMESGAGVVERKQFNIAVARVKASGVGVEGARKKRWSMKRLKKGVCAVMVRA